MSVVHEELDRHQFHRGDPEAPEVLDRMLGGQPGISSAKGRGNLRMGSREPFDMQFVDDRVLPGNVGFFVLSP